MSGFSPLHIFSKQKYVCSKKSLLIAAAFMCVAMPCAVLANGIDVEPDTSTGATDLPFSIKGQQIMDMTTSGLNVTGNVSATGIVAGTGGVQSNNSVNVSNWDAKFTTVDDQTGKLYQLIGTYHGWDPDSIMIGGYNAGDTNNLGAARSVSIGGWGTGSYTTEFVDLINHDVGINTNGPIGTLDVENKTGNATICLNGTCTNNIAIPGPAGPPGPPGAQGQQGLQGPAGSVTNVNCPSGQVLTGISNGNAVCNYVYALPGHLAVHTTIATVNPICVGNPPDPNPPGYDEFEYRITCATRFCSNQFGYSFGMLTENGAGMNNSNPYNSNPNTDVYIICSN